MFLNCRSLVFSTLLWVSGSTMAHCSELCVGVNDELDLPLSGSWVNVVALTTAKSYTITSDVKGRACFRLPEGVYSIESGHVGYLNVRYYPIRVLLANRLTEIVMRLPVGEGTEGGLSLDAVLNGAVMREDRPITFGWVCVVQRESRAKVSCGLTDEFGEYVISVVPGTYDVEVYALKTLLFSSTVDLSTPGLYRKRIVIPATSKGR
jgi:hypothetical protein